MSLSNGFLPVSPSSAVGNSQGTISVGTQFAQRFTCPGTGLQPVSEIGIWVDNTGVGDKYLTLCIFTNDPVNTCPEAIVANSETPSTLFNNTTKAKVSHTYTGTLPSLIGGDEYWLAVIVGGDTDIYYGGTTGSNCISGAALEYVFETGSQWHPPNHVDQVTIDLEIYAVTYKEEVDDITIAINQSSQSLSSSSSSQSSSSQSSSSSSESEGSPSSSSSYSLEQGDHCWGHETGVKEDYIWRFDQGDSWTCTIAGTDDDERIHLTQGQEWISNIKRVGIEYLEFKLNSYQSGLGQNPEVYKKEGETKAVCNSDTWTKVTKTGYSWRFTPSSAHEWVQMRVRMSSSSSSS